MKGFTQRSETPLEDVSLEFFILFLFGVVTAEFSVLALDGVKVAWCQIT